MSDTLDSKIDSLVKSISDGSVTRLKKKWHFYHNSRQALEMMAEDIKPRAKQAIKQLIDSEVKKARIDEVSLFVDVDTIPGIPIPVCSTCEGIYDYAKERLAQLKESQESGGTVK